MLVTKNLRGQLLVVRGVVFDMDGTLTLPQNYMFGEMRAALGITKEVDILEHLCALPEGERDAASSRVEEIERRAMAEMALQPGTHALLAHLQGHAVPAALCTRNFDIPVQHLRSALLGEYSLHPVVTRSFQPPKPAPDGILRISRELDLSPKEMLMVGDSKDDIEAARRAGTPAALLRNPDNAHLVDELEIALVVDSLGELMGLLRPVSE